MAFKAAVLPEKLATVTEGKNFVQIDRLLQSGLDALGIIASLFQTAAFFSCIFDANCFELYKTI